LIFARRRDGHDWRYLKDSESNNATSNCGRSVGRRRRSGFGRYARVSPTSGPHNARHGRYNKEENNCQAEGDTVEGANQEDCSQAKGDDEDSCKEALTGEGNGFSDKKDAGVN
jgi:hypothetical protein